MATIRPDDLPAAGSVGTTDAIIIDNGATVSKATPVQIIDAAAPLASQDDAEAGTDNVKRMSALRVKQAMDANMATTDALAADTGLELIGTPEGNAQEALDARRRLFSTRSLLADTALTSGSQTGLSEAGREGDFTFNGSDLSALVAIDTEQGVFIAPDSDDTGASGASVRQIERSLNAKHFGVTGSSIVDDGPALQAAINVAGAVGYELYIPFANLHIDTDIELADDGLVIRGFGNRRTQLNFTANAQFRTKPGATDNDYQTKRITLHDLMFFVADSDARSTPTVQFTHTNYLTAYNCTFYGDTPKTQAALEVKSALYHRYFACDFWGGAYGVLGGDASTNTANDIQFFGCSWNGSTIAVGGGFIRGGAIGFSCQSVGDGFVLSGNANVTTANFTIRDGYFEAVTNRCVSAGTNGTVYGLVVEGNYIASLAGGTVAPIYIKRVSGFSIRGNDWNGYDASVTGMVEVDSLVAKPASTAIYFPRKGSIRDNTSLYTDERSGWFWSANIADISTPVTATIDDQKSQIVGATEGFGTGRQKKLSGILDLSATGTVNSTLFDSSNHIFIHGAKFLCDKGIDVSANLTVGVSSSITYHVSTTALGTKAAQSVTTLTINNPQQRPTNGTIFARVVTTVVTTGGNGRVQVEYSEA